MYDMKPLEVEWKKYKSKKRRPFYMVLLFLSVVSMISFFNMSSFKGVNDYVSKLYKTSVIKKSSEPNKMINPSLVNVALKEIEGSDTSKHKDKKTLVNASELLVDIPILDVNDVKVTDIKSDSVRRKVFLDIVESSSVSAYEDVEKRFAQSHDIDDALFLTKSYFKKENYEKAAYWAYEVNKLNEDIEESVLIFVKSKVELGQVNEARSILNTYINKSNSTEAKKILSKIEDNKL